MWVMKRLKIDVMIMGGARFYKTLFYTYNPLFKIKIEDIAAFAMDKLPSLKNRNDVELVVYK